MNTFDDLFDASAAKNNRNDQPFDKDAWAAKKQEQRQAVYDLADSTAEAIAADGGRFRDYLDVQSRFDRYTATNALLILAQKPEATQLRDFESWRSTGAFIKRQEMSHGISILEPGDEYKREVGSIGTYYNVKKVYDVSQTNTRMKVQPTVSMDERLLLKALIHRPPVPMQTVDELPNNMGALYDHDQKVIFVRRGMTADDIFRSVSKELAHAEIAGARSEYYREDDAFASYRVSYLLCRKYGIDVSGYDFSRLPEDFRVADPQSIRAALSEMRDTANTISGRMYRVLEQNKAPKSKEQER